MGVANGDFNEGTCRGQRMRVASGNAAFAAPRSAFYDEIITPQSMLVPFLPPDSKAGNQTEECSSSKSDSAFSGRAQPKNRQARSQLCDAWHSSFRWLVVDYLCSAGAGLQLSQSDGAKLQQSEVRTLQATCRVARVKVKLESELRYPSSDGGFLPF